MKISYDPAKGEKNLRERGLSFELVRQFDIGQAWVFEDIRRDYGERRWTAVGLLYGRMHVLVFTETSDGLRVISFRKANKREVRKYGSRP